MKVGREMEQRPDEAPEFYQSSFDLFACGEIEEDSEPVHLETTTDPEPAQRELTELELVLQIRAEGYGVYSFAKDNPARNCFRRYIITYQPSLWDRYTVSRQWGRLGSERQLYRDEHFRSPRHASARVRGLIKRRLKRGYALTNIAC